MLLINNMKTIRATFMPYIFQPIKKDIIMFCFMFSLDISSH